MTKYYLYRHIRPDKNEPFYIGIGTKSEQDLKYNSYRRAYQKHNRKRLWNSIVSKNSGNYEVEILLESDDYSFILSKEIEFIRLYGRIDLKTGTLANHTDGGEGVKNRIVSEETRKKIGEKNKLQILTFERKDYLKKLRLGSKASEETKKKMSESGIKRGHRSANNILSKKVYQYSDKLSLINIWNSSMDIERDLGINNSRISDACRRSNHFYRGYFWSFEPLNKLPEIKNSVRKINQIEPSTGEVIKAFETLKEACLEFYKNHRCGYKELKDCLEGKRLLFKNYKWTYGQ